MVEEYETEYLFSTRTKAEEYIEKYNLETWLYKTVSKRDNYSLEQLRQVRIILEGDATSINPANRKVLQVVDAVINKYGPNDRIRVDISADGKMLDLKLRFSGNWTNTCDDFVETSLANISECNLSELKKELDKRNVEYCGW